MANIQSIRRNPTGGPLDTLDAVEGALLIQSAQAVRGPQQQALLRQGRRLLRRAIDLEGSLRWTFRHELRMSAGD